MEQGTRHEKSQESDIAQQALEDILSAVPVQNNMEEHLVHAQALDGKDGKADIKNTIDNLIPEGQRVVSESVVAAKGDHTYFPNYDAIKSVFKSVKDGFKDGKYTNRLKSALSSIYDTVVQEAAINKAIARIQAAPLEMAKKAAVSLANSSSDKYLVDRIKEADTVAEVASYARRSLQTLWGKGKEYFQNEGGMGKFKDMYAPAYVGTPSGKGKH